jgi:hypothetical protein
MEQLIQFSLENGINFLESSSFKINCDGTTEIRPLYRMNITNSQLKIFLSYFENPCVFDFLLNRFHILTTFVAVKPGRSNYLKISSCCLLFNPNNTVCYSVEIDCGKIIQQVYRTTKYQNSNIIKVPLVLRESIFKNVIVTRNDGQQYLLLHTSTTKEKIKSIYNSEIFHKWVDEQNGNPFWFQFSKNSMTIYYRNNDYFLPV